MIILSFFSLATTSVDPIYLGIGDTYKLSSRPLETLRVQRKGIMSVKDEGSQILLTAKKLGETFIHLGRTKKHFIVLHKKKYQSFIALKSWASGRRGPQISVNQGQVYLQGRILKLQDFKSLPQFTKMYPHFINHAQVPIQLKEELITDLKKTLQHLNLPAGEFSMNGDWTLRLSQQLQKQKAEYKKLLAPYGIKLLWDGNAVNKPLVTIQLYISHVQKSWMRHWGLNWPTEGSFSLVPGNPLQWSSFALSLQALEQKGFGKVLASPSLTTESGKTAEFHSGGEFPIKTSTQFNNVVQWKKYGLFLKATPFKNAKNHLHLKINLSMSSLDHSRSSDGIPALIKSEVKTEVNMQQPQPIILSGFSHQSQNSLRSGLPWLQQIPILKPLFSTRSIYDDDYELIFILIPHYHDTRI